MSIPNKKPGKAITASAAALLLLGALLIPSEKRVHKPYYDLAGVLTVCEGLTGRWIDKSKTYTDAECEAMTQKYLADMTAKIGACAGPMTDASFIAWGHFAYNVGTAGFCNSTAARLLREGHPEAACAQMKKWTFVTIDGRKVNCRLAGRTCPGIVKRRDYEYELCMEALK